MAHIGQQFGDYRLIKRIGTGGTAIVYLGERIDMPTMKAAIKILKTDIDNDTIKKTFLREVEIMAHLSHHNHIVRIFDFGVKDIEPYIIMDLILGGNLGQIHSSHTPLAGEIIISYIKQIADALYYAHSQHPQIVHCDLKPQNIFLHQNQHIFIGDFGYARVRQSTQQHSATPEGATWQYTAPEQIDSKRYGEKCPATDQYALGVMVYQWLSGHLPFTSDMPELLHQHLEETPPSLRKLQPNLSSKVEEVVFKALAKSSSDRFSNIKAFASALEAVLQSPTLTLTAIDEITASKNSENSKDMKELSEELHNNAHSVQFYETSISTITPTPHLSVNNQHTTTVDPQSGKTLRPISTIVAMVSKARPVIGAIIGVVGILGILFTDLGIFGGIGIFANLSAISGAHAASIFFNSAHNIQGVVQYSYQIIPNSQTGTDKSCSTTVIFTPPGYTTSFTTTDTQCNALDKGTVAEVFYAPRNPNIAKTARQNAADLAGERTGTVLAGLFGTALAIGAVIFIASLIGGWKLNLYSSDYSDY